ncbi:hypothetical protein BH23CHL2_BH23CHL2_30000 [soil metagenome]
MKATSQPAFYARTGNLAGNLLTILHLPYTAWHLSYVVFGAALVGDLDWIRLAGTMLAFFAGTGVAAHALDEFNGRPLNTDLSDTTLLVLAGLGFLAALAVTAAGIVVISPWVVAWAVAGFVLAAAYPLEWFGGRIHTDLGFALSWGAFPVLVGAWAQAEALTVPVIGVALAATLLSLAQRALSTPARFVRREADDVVVEIQHAGRGQQWTDTELLDTWEAPLRFLTWAVVVLAVSLVLLQV